VNIELYKGSLIQDGVRATALLPYVEDDIKKGDTVRLLNATLDVLATAVVEDIKVETFAALQNSQLADNVHPELRHWANAFAFLQARHVGFQQTEKVTLLTLMPALQPVQAHEEEVMFADETGAEADEDED
jgi:hypothetical protein